MRSPGHYISLQIRHFFKQTGFLVYRYPAPFFWLPIIFTVICCAGLLRFHEENRIWYLYSPSEAHSHYEHAVANEFFNDRGGKFWLELAITSQDLGNLLRQGHFDDVVQLADFIQYNFTVPCALKGLSDCSFNDMCSGSTCAENQVIPLFNLIYRNASSRLHPNFRLTFPTMHLYNDEYYVGEHFAGVQIDNRTNVINSVKVAVLYFRTDRQNQPTAEALNRWEEKIFDYVDHFAHPHLNITVNSDRRIAQEVRKNGLSCIPFFGISVCIVYFFIWITNRREHFTFTHSIVMSFLGVIGPLMATGTTFCFMFLVGVPFNSITLVMPFLIIGVGSDDVFIIIHAMRATDKRKGLEEQIAETMEEAGPSITVTSATNILSFGIGVWTSTPAISIFCLYTAVGVTIDFIYQLTFFVAALVYEEKRLAAQSEKEKPPLDIEVSRKQVISAQPSLHSIHPADPTGIIATYCKWLNWWPTRVLLFAVLLVYWTASIYGCIKMEIKMDTTNLVMKDSPLHNVAHVYEKYLWSEGQLVLVFVNNPPDVSVELNQHMLFELVDRFETLPYAMGRNSTSFWLRTFLYQSALYHTKEDFYQLLDRWLQDPENGGARWNDMIRLNRGLDGNATGIDRFLFSTACAMGKDASWLTRAHIQHEWRGLASQYDNFNVTVFQSYSFYVDQLDSIAMNTLSTVVVAAITMDLACFLMIPGAVSIITSSVAMASINVGVFGLLSVWDVNLDPITMCTTLMSIGFSVDFTAHISYHYYRNPLEWTVDERLADALRCIGWPMVQAGISTLCCVSPLLLIDSYMVTVFTKTIFLVISLGLIHGIVVLPALLLTFGSKGNKKEITPTVPTLTAITLPEKSIEMKKPRKHVEIQEEVTELPISPVKSEKNLREQG